LAKPVQTDAASGQKGAASSPGYGSTLGHPNLKWSEVIRSDQKWSVDVNFPSTSDIDDSISKKTRCRVQLHLGSVEQGIIRGVVMSCVEHITELHRKMARSQDFAFQKVSGICHRNTQK
jgi:hypothetical protein